MTLKSIATATLFIACLLVGCAQPPRLVITEYEKSTLFGLERVTYNDDANEELASVVKGMLAYDTIKDGQWEIYTKAVTGKQETRKTTSPAMDNGPALSADGQRLAFVSNRGGSMAVYVMNAVQASAQMLIGEGTNPAFSPTCDVLYYQRYLPSENATSIWQYDFKTAQHSLLGAGFNPAPSPDGKLLAYCKYNPITGNDGIWLLNIDNSQEMEVFSLKDAGVVNPCWSPDGKYLLFTTTRGPLNRKQAPSDMTNLPSPQLAVVKADGTGFTLLTDNDTNNVGRAWGDDGYIYFSSYRMKSQDIWRFKPKMD
jgi:Tol biopolymer transport system component